MLQWQQQHSYSHYSLNETHATCGDTESFWMKSVSRGATKSQVNSGNIEVEMRLCEYQLNRGNSSCEIKWLQILNTRVDSIKI